MEKFLSLYQGNVEQVPEEELYDIVSQSYHAYRVQQPIIPDSLYDLLETRLLSIDPSAMERIDAEVGLRLYREHIKLPHEMNGIVQVNDVSKGIVETDQVLRNYISVCGVKQYVVSDKLDGCSVMLWYRGGKLRQAFSKHSGDEGLDITRHLQMMKNVPNTIPTKEETFVRGEAIIPTEVFERGWSVRNGTGEYSNPRNFVAGKLNSKEPEQKSLSEILFVAYTICGSTKNKQEQLTLLKQMGFEVVVSRVVDSSSLNKKYLDDLTSSARSESRFELDGLVLDANGSVHNEDHTRKYKVIAETAEATVVSVEWNLMKDGDFRPVVVIEPIDLGGVTVSRASAFNAFYIKHGRLKSETHKPDFPIGPGAKISIIRSGDVIPDIQAVLVPSAVPSLPCESVWGEYEWSESGIHIRTKDVNHPLVRLRNLSYFFDTIGVEDFRETSVSKVIEKFPESTVSSICRMKPQEFVYCGFGVKQANKIFENIRTKLSDMKFPEFMAASNKFGRLWGVKRCTRVWNELKGNIESIRTLGRDKTYSILLGMDDIAEATAAEFVRNVDSFFEFYDEMKDITKFCPYLVKPEVVEDGALEGWFVVFTGFRDESLEELITSNGGVISTWSNPTHIVAKDTSVMRPKIQKAIDKGAVFMDRSKFSVLVNKTIDDFTS